MWLLRKPSDLSIVEASVHTSIVGSLRSSSIFASTELGGRGLQSFSSGELLPSICVAARAKAFAPGRRSRIWSLLGWLASVSSQSTPKSTPSLLAKHLCSLFDAFTHHGVWGSLKTGPWAPLFFHSRMCNVVRPSTRRSSEGLKQQADAAAAL